MVSPRRVLSAVGPEWVSTSEVVERVGLSHRYTWGMLRDLRRAGQLEHRVITLPVGRVKTKVAEWREAR